MNKNHKRDLAAWLDERWQLALKRDKEMGNETQIFLPNNPDYIYYNAIIDTLRACGIDWKRQDHKHIIF